MSTQTAIYRKASDCTITRADWGSLTWFANGEQGNSSEMTVGRCVIKPGFSNPRHRHPNCTEVLVVHEGAIAHTLGEGREVELGPGDAITVPRNFVHQARNTGKVDAVLYISFSSADRQTIGE